MIIQSDAIVLKRFPYGESSIICRCFVKEIGKTSFIVHGAHRKKSSKAAYFQPGNCINIIFYYKDNRNLQTISKTSFSKNWIHIQNDLKKIAYTMAVIELTDKCISENDEHKDLFIILLNVLEKIENEPSELNLIYWYYQYQLLEKLGFKPDFDQSELDFIPLPNPYKSTNAKMVFGCFENGEMGINKNISLLKNDRKIISNYLNTCLGIHFSELKNIKSLKVLNSLLN